EATATADLLRREGMAAFAERYATGPTRVQFANKDPRGHAEFKRMLAEHSAVGSANTQLGVQRERPSLYDLTDALARITVPTLIVSGDEDWPCLAPSLMLKRVIPSAGLAILPNTGHALSVEEPDAYNAVLDAFLGQVETKRWPMRDPRSASATITGIAG
ncbi:MAG: alpha/beta hydrolase, partial [Actinomycetospora chiangmaiensis]|nr:alpha/beta hydrolase [Actinomycetospora chiangmaiensis]